MSEPTKRQLEMLINIYLGDHWDGKRELKPWDPSDTSEFPPWGTTSRWGIRSSMGGAARRARDRMGEAGWLVRKESRFSVYYRDQLTTSGLEILQRRYPTLPDIDARITASRAADEAAAEEERKRQAAEREDRQRRAAVRHSERARLLREIMQGYQISLDSLTGDQCADIWNEIVKKDLDL